MRYLSLLCTIVLVFFVSCGKPVKVPLSIDPQSVDPQKVKSIVITNSDAEKTLCRTEIENLGANILYEGKTGILFTNKSTSELNLRKCRATLTSNEELSLSPADPTDEQSREPGPDLPTLLKLIPAEKIGARTFVKNNPTYDGRGVIIAVLDTGVEMDHPMLQKTTTGDYKIIANHDFSGEGRVELSPADLNEGVISGSNGQAYLVGKIDSSSFTFGIFNGSSLIYSEDISKKDTFKDLGVIAYLASDGIWKGRIDTNDDKSFDDEVELFAFGKSRKFIKLGEKKTLTTAMYVAPEGKSANLVFDDGGHGTHVAGIAAGYDPSGLRGVAPGAQVIGAKIGDNRLPGGSTTTASMLMAIDWAVSEGAHIINLSYGIRAGSNIGKSTIDKFVDKVAKENDVLFSISAGNEGPGMLSVGTPAGGELVFTNAAYLPKETAQNHYGYLNVEEDLLWFFSSVGPQLDGSWKPTLLAPGTALSSIPPNMGGHANYSGTSMAAPQVSGGLALLVSSALQEDLPTDRPLIAHAVYQSATKVPLLTLIEQGHGLMNVPKAHKLLKELKGTLPIEYSLSVNSPTAPNGRGKGIYIRSRNLPANFFTIQVYPKFPKETPEEIKNQVKTYKLVPSAKWIHTPSHFFMMGSMRLFRADLDKSIMKKPGLYSEKITAIHEATGRVAFEVPVTVVVPHLLNDQNNYEFTDEITIKVGHTKRLFLNLPAGTSAVHIDLVSDGPMVWGQFLDPEGRVLTDFYPKKRQSPVPPLLGQTNTSRAGVYELDIVAPAYNQRPAQVKVKVKAFSVSVVKGPDKSKGVFDVIVENNFDPLMVRHSTEIGSVSKTESLEINGSEVTLPFAIERPELDKFSEIKFGIKTSMDIYDLMTDYGYRITDPNKKLIKHGGLNLKASVGIDKLKKRDEGLYLLRIFGAFTEKPPEAWGFEITEEYVLETPVKILEGVTTLLDSGQRLYIPLDLSGHMTPLIKGMNNCLNIDFENSSGRLIQNKSLCF